MPQYVRFVVLTWLITCTALGRLAAQSFTAEALGFNVFLENTFKFGGGDVEGAVALGGDLTIQGNWGQFTNHTAGTYTIAGVSGHVGLVVGGRLYLNGGGLNMLSGSRVRIASNTGTQAIGFQNNTQVNTRIVNSNGNYNSNPYINLDHHQAPSLIYGATGIDFAAAFTTFRSRATAVSACQTTVNVTNANGNPLDLGNLPNNAGVYIQSLANGENILNITAANLNKIQNLTFNAQPSSAKYLIINVDAPGTFNWDNFTFAGIGSQQAPYILFNFYNTTTLNINRSNSVYATVFAPSAVVKKNNSANIDGQVIATDFEMLQSGEVHKWYFASNIPSCAAPVCNLDIVVVQSIQANCLNSDGTLSVVVSGGTAPVSYSIDGGTTYQSSYLFQNLPAGTYAVKVKDANNCTDTLTVQLGATACSSLGDFVWLDEDENGIFDGGELGVGGVAVYLYADTDGNGTPDGAALQQTTTTPNGAYSFQNLAQGKYLVAFVPAPGYSVTLRDAGSDDALDSDPLPETGRTASITLPAGTHDPSWDLGLVAPCVPAGIVHTEHYDVIADAQAQFARMHVAAEGRIGGAPTYEMDIHRVSPFSVFNQSEFPWVNGQAEPFSITYDPQATGSDRYVFEMGNGVAQFILKLDPLAPTSGAPFVLDFDAIWIFARATQSSGGAIVLDNLVLNGSALGDGVNLPAASSPDFDNLLIKGEDLYNGFTFTGTVTMSWTGARPTQSNINFGVKLGKLKDCFTCDLPDGGQIAGEESNCGPYDPAAIAHVAAPGAAAYAYQWYYSADPGLPFDQWVEIAGATGTSYDPDPISETLYFVRLARYDYCSDFTGASNIVAKVVGSKPLAYFTATGTNCSGSAVTFTATNAGAGAVYTWYFVPGAAPASGQSTTYTWNLAGTYAPMLTVSLGGCDSSFTQEVMIDDCTICDNITGGGAITGGQASCIVPFDPAPIVNKNLPNTGTGALEFVWLMTDDPNRPQNQWTMIPNSNAPDYDPGPVTETTYFLRCVRHVGCSSFKESNVIAIQIVENAYNLCEPADFAPGGFSLELDLTDGTTTGQYYISPDDRKFVTYSDGTAKLEALFIHTQNSNQRWYGTLWFKNLRDWGQWRHAGGTYYPGIHDTDHPSWDYYELNPSQSVLEGRLKFKGKTLTLSAGTDGLQVGYGANTENGDRGAYGEFAYAGSYSGTLRLSIAFNACQEYCVPNPLVAARVFLQSAYDPNTGQMASALSSGTMLPLSQPFNIAPWYYSGTESVGTLPNPDITDWLLIELRDSLNPALVLDRRAVFLLKDGNLADMDGYSLPTFAVNPDQPYFLNIISRNHLDAMSSLPKDRMGRVIWQNFTTSPGQSYTNGSIPNPPVVDVDSGIYALIGGDVNRDGVINATDFNVVVYFFFQFGYTMGDVNNDGVVNATDYLNIVYNYFKFSHVPQN
ncbi:MAG: hypothetical protein OHK0039_15450 [Bacteroidia bacterium]